MEQGRLPWLAAAAQSADWPSHREASLGVGRRGWAWAEEADPGWHGTAELGLVGAVLVPHCGKVKVRLPAVATQGQLGDSNRRAGKFTVGPAVIWAV